MEFNIKRFDKLPEIMTIEPKLHLDGRGWFFEAYKQSDFKSLGILDFVQDNHTRSDAMGTLRGLHFQKEPTAQGKLVRCVLGQIFDVAVDIRKGSPTYAKWVSATLSAENHMMMWVPPGFAHGVMTLAESTEILYKVTAEYSHTNDRSIRWDDPSLGITWPILNPTLSKKDADAPLLSESDNNFVWNLNCAER